MIRHVSGRVNQKKEKRERNEAQAKKFKRRPRVADKPSKKEMSNYCRTPGHPRSCQFDTCPSWNP
jgi:hypothetical protein